jgi:hypothetical protein
MAEETTAVETKKSAKSKTLQMEYAVYDAQVGKKFNPGEQVEEVTPYLQALIDAGDVKLV